MAILKRLRSGSLIECAHMSITTFRNVAPKIAPRENHDAHCVAWQLQSAKVSQIAPGKYVKSAKPWHAGYQLSSPKGITLITRKGEKRFSIH